MTAAGLGVLDQRILTAGLLAPLVVAAILLLSSAQVAVLIGAVVLVGAWEWSRLAGLAAALPRGAYTAAMAAVLAAAMLLLRSPPLDLWLLGGASLWWLLAALLLARVRLDPQPRRELSPSQAAAGFPVLVPAWAALVALHGSAPAGPALVVFLLLTIWVSDSAAFYTGRRWGRSKLAPVLSPGKTWAGLYGALAGSALCAGFLAWWSPVQGVAPWVALALCWAATLASVVGDLFESLMKRRRGAKDSGRLLPGHGGMLDRIDSLTAAAPVFTFGLMLVGLRG